MTYESLIDRWHESIRHSQKAHYRTATLLARYHFALGLVTVVLSTVVGSSLFSTLQKEASFSAKLIIGAASVLAAVFAAAQGFLRYSERADTHRKVAAALSAMKRELEVQQAFPAQERGEQSQYASDFLARWRALLEDAPTPDDGIFQRVRIELENEPRASVLRARALEA